MHVCVNCQKTLEAGTQTCPACGCAALPAPERPGSPATVNAYCGNCGTAVARGSQFCSNCGQPAGSQDAQQAPPGVYGAQQPAYGAVPAYTPSPNRGTPPPNHLTFAVISLVLGIWLLGIPAVLNASRVDSLWAAGDVAGAHLASGKAHKFATWSLAVCAVVVLGYVVLFALVGSGTAAGH